MFKRSRHITMILTLTFSLLFWAVPLQAQNSVNDWSGVTSLQSGSRLVVKLKNGKSVEGKLSKASDSSLALNVKNSSQEIKREEIQSVHQLSRKSATKATLIGTAVGAGAGAAVGAVGGRDSDFDKLDQAVTAGLTVIGAGIGAIGGYLIGRSGRKRELIYESQ
jgi:small nuclear ribonucleoprotein (snRNP)-like protein